MFCYAELPLEEEITFCNAQLPSKNKMRFVNVMLSYLQKNQMWYSVKLITVVSYANLQKHSGRLVSHCQL